MKTNDQITQPTLMADGLALYRIGQSEPLFLMPYPHASASATTADTKLATLLASLPRQVLTFDPPGAYGSTRSGRADLPEMLDCALETLSMCQISEPIDVIGHSMSGLCALALAVEHPERARRLVLVGSVSGFPAVRRWSIPHNWRWWRDREYWQALWWGFRLFIGWNNLAIHKRLNNLVETASFVDKSLAELAEIEVGDNQSPPPKRDKWFKTVRGVDYKERLPELQALTLLCVGRYDPQTPVACSRCRLRRKQWLRLPDILQVVFRDLAADSEVMTNSCLFEVTPENEFVTYGVGVPLRQMRYPEKARGRAPAGQAASTEAVV